MTERDNNVYMKSDQYQLVSLFSISNISFVMFSNQVQFAFMYSHSFTRWMFISEFDKCFDLSRKPTADDTVCYAEPNEINITLNVYYFSLTMFTCISCLQIACQLCCTGFSKFDQGSYQDFTSMSPRTPLIKHG